MEQSRFTGQDNIVLIGMPGSGKSTIGVVLAKILNYEFVDVDLMIQQRADKTLQRLIDALGPEGFIELESQVLNSLDLRHALISTGGSAVYSEEALDQLAQGGVIVYLQIALPELKERLADFSERGVVMRGAGAMNLDALYAERVPLYEQHADVTVNIDGLTITEAANKVRAVLGL